MLVVVGAAMAAIAHATYQRVKMSPAKTDKQKRRAKAVLIVMPTLIFLNLLFFDDPYESGLVTIIKAVLKVLGLAIVYYVSVEPS